MESVGSLMEGSGLREALETNYASLTVGHMTTRKVFTRAARGHMMSASVVLSLLLEEYWYSLTAAERAKLVKIYDSAKPGNVKIKSLKKGLQCKGISRTYMFKCTSNQT